MKRLLIPFLTLLAALFIACGGGDNGTNGGAAGNGGSPTTTISQAGNGGSGGQAGGVETGGGTGTTSTTTSFVQPDPELTFICQTGYQFVGIAPNDPDGVLAMGSFAGPNPDVEGYFYGLFQGSVGGSTCGKYDHKLNLFYDGSMPSDAPQNIVQLAQNGIAVQWTSGDFRIFPIQFKNALSIGTDGSNNDQHLYSGTPLVHQQPGDTNSICPLICKPGPKALVAEQWYSTNGSAPYKFKTLASWGIDGDYTMGVYAKTPDWKKLFPDIQGAAVPSGPSSAEDAFTQFVHRALARPVYPPQQVWSAKLVTEPGMHGPRVYQPLDRYGRPITTVSMTVAPTRVVDLPAPN